MICAGGGQAPLPTTPNKAMMFSTKAEYGVRVMVALAQRAQASPDGEEPVMPLAEIAEHDGLPLAYLEHLVARLRKAGLIESRRARAAGTCSRGRQRRSRWPRWWRRWRARSPRSSASPRTRREHRVLARAGSRPRVPYQAAVDARALLDREHVDGHHARRSAAGARPPWPPRSHPGAAGAKPH